MCFNKQADSTDVAGKSKLLNLDITTFENQKSIK